MVSSIYNTARAVTNYALNSRPVQAVTATAHRAQSTVSDFFSDHYPVIVTIGLAYTNVRGVYSLINSESPADTFWAGSAVIMSLAALILISSLANLSLYERLVGSLERQVNVQERLINIVERRVSVQEQLIATHQAEVNTYQQAMVTQQERANLRRQQIDSQREIIQAQHNELSFVNRFGQFRGGD